MSPQPTDKSRIFAAVFGRVGHRWIFYGKPEKEEIDDGKTVRLGDFGLFRPSFVGKSTDTEAGVSASNIVRKRILFFPGKAFSQMLGNMSVTKMVVPDTDYTDGSSNGGGDNSNPSGGNDGDQGENPLG